MADITIQKQGEVFISQSEYDALRLAGNLQSNTKYHITKTPETATKDFVNDGFVAKVTITSGSNLAYIAKNNGTQDTVPIAQMPYQNTIAQRGAGGTLKVGTPEGVSDATPKAYVDGLHHYSHHIHITDGTSEIYITLAIKDYPDAVTDLGSAVELVEVLTGQMQPIMATGVVNGHNVHAVLVQADRKMYAKYYDSTKNMILTDKVDVLLPGTVTVHDIVA